VLFRSDVCGSPAPTCPAACPAVAPCEPTCPPIPAAVGAGPMPAICNLTCPADFDKAFVQAAYQNNADIIGLATLGIQQSTSSELRGLSGKIRNERTQHNQKLVKFARMIGECNLNLVCNACLTDQISTLVGQDFNVRYAVLMVGLLMQAQDAAKAGMSQSGIADLRNQNRISYRAAENEIAAFQSWLVRNGISCSPGAPCGAGPVCATIPPPSPCPAPCPTTCPPPCPAPCPPAAGPACPAPCPAQCPAPAAQPCPIVPAPCPCPTTSP
jgi:hypothetical protein